MSAPSVKKLPLRRLAGLILVGVVVLTAAAFATGRVRYVVTHGISMEPLYHTGELVIVAPSAGYHVGDIVAYLGGPTGHLEILHRIIGGNAGGFTIKGDNNPLPDPSHPRADQLIGKAVLAVPSVGGLIESPTTKALAVLALVAVVGLLVKKPAPPPGAAYGSRRASDRSTTTWKTFIAADVVLLAAVGLTFGVVAPPKPATPPAYNETGALSYHATPPVSATYPTGQVATGDPVFTKLLDRVPVSFRYRTDAPLPLLKGTVRLDAALSAQTGWHASLPLVAPTPLAGDRVDLTTTLDLAHIEALGLRVTRATGVGIYTIDVGVTATAHVVIGSAPPVDYTWQLPVSLSPYEMTVSGGKLSPTPQGPAIVSTNSLTPIVAPASKSTGTHTLRILLLALLLISAAGTAVVWPEHLSGNAKIAVVRTRAVGVEVADATNRIQVPDRATLVQVALRHETAIIQGADGWEGVFAQGSMYWAVTPPSPTPAVGEAPTAAVEAPTAPHSYPTRPDEAATTNGDPSQGAPVTDGRATNGRATNGSTSATVGAE